MGAIGIRWDFAPVIAVPQDVRWGRTYEGYGEDPALVDAPRAPRSSPVSRARTSPPTTRWPPRPSTSSATAGRPGARRPLRDYSLDQGVTDVDDATLRAVHLAPYQPAIDAGVRIVMASFSSTTGRQAPRRPPPADRRAQGRARLLAGSSSRTGPASTRSRPTTRPPSRDRSWPAWTWSWSRTTRRRSRRPSDAGPRGRHDRPGADRRRGPAHPAGQVRDGALRAADAAGRAAPPTSARAPIGRSPERPSRGPRSCSRPAPGVLPVGAARHGPAWPARRPTTSVANPVAGRSPGRGGPGPITPGRPSPTRSAAGWAIDSTYDGGAAFGPDARADVGDRRRRRARRTPKAVGDSADAGAAARGRRPRRPDAFARRPARGRRPVRTPGDARRDPRTGRRGDRGVAAGHRGRRAGRRAARRSAVHRDDAVHLAAHARPMRPGPAWRRARRGLPARLRPRRVRARCSAPAAVCDRRTSTPDATDAPIRRAIRSCATPTA